MEPEAPGAGGAPGFEERLWRVAEELRGHVEPAEYKHVVLGLLFLRFALDPALAAAGAPPLDMPPGASWASLRDEARAGNAARAIPEAIAAIERARPALRGIGAFDARPIDGRRLGAWVDAIDAIPVGATGARDVLGRIYEYFLAHFASSEGRSGGEYYTPRSVVELLVSMIEPTAGTLYDPCCGTAGMFVQSERLRGSRENEGPGLTFYGQESSPRARQIARMNLALRGIDADLGGRAADTFGEDLHPSLRADFVLANPPFNARAWGAEALADDPRWTFGVPPRHGANYAWIQHILWHVKPDGVAAFVLANGSLSSDQGGEGALRKRLIEADVVECVVTLPAQLFYGTQIPACVWIVSPGKARRGASATLGRTLFIDARALGRPVDRVHAELAPEEVERIAATYRRWRRGEDYRDMPGFARSASLPEIRHHRYALVPGRYVGFARPAGSPHPADEGGLESDADVRIAEVRGRLDEVHAASARVLAALQALRDG